MTTSAPARHDGLAAGLSDALTMVDRSVRLTRRNVDTLLTSVLLPIMIMLMFVFVFGGAIRTGTEYVTYVVPGIVLLCTGYGAANTAMVVADDMTKGMVDRLRSMPIRSSAVLIGHVTASLARNAVATTLVVLVALLVGFRPTATAGEWLLAAGLLLLYVLGMSWLAAGVGVIARNVESAGVFSFFMLFLPYLSSAFVPTGTMPGFLRVISENQPITPVTETVRGLLTGTPIGGNGWLAVAWCVGLVLVSYAFATAMYVRRARR
ncbi:MAG TPA: ABC transporter permease [Pseudonocardia sp.]|nr:ABC transporter permease [Pseudonocardia sp.]